MTKFTRQLLSRKHQRQKSDNASANIPAAVLRYPSLCCAMRMGYAEVIFIQPGGKLDIICDVVLWQRLASSYPTSSWDVAVTNSHCSRTVLPVTHTAIRNTETCSVTAWEPSVHWAKHFVHRIWTRLTCHMEVLFGRWSTIIKVSPQLTKWRQRLSKAWQKLPHGAVIADSSLLSPFYFAVKVIRQMAPLFSKTDSDK